MDQGLRHGSPTGHGMRKCYHGWFLKGELHTATRGAFKFLIAELYATCRIMAHPLSTS